MVYSVQQIKYEILAYIKEFGGEFSDYYVGVSDNPKKSLFKVHNVNRKKDPWLYKQALTLQAAKTASRSLQEAPGSILEPCWHPKVLQNTSYRFFFKLF